MKGPRPRRLGEPLTLIMFPYGASVQIYRTGQRGTIAGRTDDAKVIVNGEDGRIYEFPPNKRAIPLAEITGEVMNKRDQKEIDQKPRALFLADALELYGKCDEKTCLFYVSEAAKELRKLYMFSEKFFFVCERATSTTNEDEDMSATGMMLTVMNQYKKGIPEEEEETA